VMSKFCVSKIVELDYFDLLNGNDLRREIGEAFGFDGVGALTVKNVPDYVQAREKLLPLSLKFANLPDHIKEKYVHLESSYSFGWSHGKENLQGKPDISKGSYYANPQYDRPIDDENIIAEHSAFIHPNIWPKDDLPEMEFAFKELGQIIVAVGKLLAKQCDAYVHSQCKTYPRNSLERIIDNSRCCKARLLHYFPLMVDSDSLANIDDVEDFSSWCGWHNDHGSLTGLTSAMFMDVNGNVVENTDATAGLFVRNRRSELIKVNIPVDHIAFQIGETSQVLSGGVLQATPHAVRGSRVPYVSRETFAVFMEPMWMDEMVCPEGVDPADAQSQSAAANLPPGVPLLSTRWRHYAEGAKPQTFGEFTNETLNAYY